MNPYLHLLLSAPSSVLKRLTEDHMTVALTRHLGVVNCFGVVQVLSSAHGYLHICHIHGAVAFHPTYYNGGSSEAQLL